MPVVTKVRVILDDAAIRHVLDSDLEAGTRLAASRTRERVRTGIMVSGRVDTGDMLRSIRFGQKTSTPERVIYEVFSDVHYTVYQEYGTRYFSGGHFFEGALKMLSISDFLP